MSQPAHQTEPVDTPQDDVNDALTAASTTASSSTTTPARRRPARKRSRSEVENTDYAAFAARVIRAHARRIADGDVEGLTDLLALREALDTATQTAVTGLRGFGYSWARSPPDSAPPARPHNSAGAGKRSRVPHTWGFGYLIPGIRSVR